MNSFVRSFSLYLGLSYIYTHKRPHCKVTFRLSEGSPLYFDKRVLVAQSEYFAEMLSNESWVEGRTHEVDLRNNPDANHQTVCAIFKFLQDGDSAALTKHTACTVTSDFMDRGLSHRLDIQV